MSEKKWREWVINSLDNNDDGPDVYVIGPNAHHVKVIEIGAVEELKRKLAEWPNNALQNVLNETSTKLAARDEEIARLREVAKWNVCNNDEYGCEFIGITLVKEELAKEREKVRGLVETLEDILGETWILLKADQDRLLNKIRDALKKYGGEGDGSQNSPTKSGPTKEEP